MESLVATVWRRLQSAAASTTPGLTPPAVPGTGTGSSTSSSANSSSTSTVNKAADLASTGGGGHVAFFVGVLVLLGALLAWWLWRLNRWRYNRARSLKVLDEIEMEFVNDDMDTDVMEDHAASGLRCARALRQRDARAQRAGGQRRRAFRRRACQPPLCQTPCLGASVHTLPSALLSCALPHVAVEGLAQRGATSPGSCRAYASARHRSCATVTSALRSVSIRRRPTSMRHHASPDGLRARRGRWAAECDPCVLWRCGHSGLDVALVAVVLLLCPLRSSLSVNVGQRPNALALSVPHLRSAIPSMLRIASGQHYRQVQLTWAMDW